MNFNHASLCHFNRRGIFFGLRDFRPFLSISLLIVRLVTLHPDECKSCSSSHETIGFWLIRRHNFLDNLREIFLRALFLNDPGDLGSIPGRVIPKTFKMVLDTSLLNTQQYKVRIKGSVEKSRERNSATPTPQCSSY